MTEVQTWFVTGSSRGLGKDIVEAALSAGHRVVATARNTEPLQELLDRYSSRIAVWNLDVTDGVGVQDVVAAAVSKFDRIDVLVNNAGYADVGSIEDMPEDMFRAQLDVNFYGVVNVTRAVLPVMRAQGSGHIMQISSVGGRVGGAGLGAYQSAKWAVGGFSEVLAKEVLHFGIKVTVIEPGGMRTDWAGSSMETLDVSEPYKQVMDPVIARLRSANGKQPGNPSRVAQVLLDVARMESPPLRLLLGTDAVSVAETAAANLAASDAKWRDLSTSIGFSE